MSFIGHSKDETYHNCVPFILPYENKWYTFIQSSKDIEANSELLLPS